jgi:cell division protein FtsB
VSRAQLQQELQYNIEMQKATAVDVEQLRGSLDALQAENAKLTIRAAEKDEHITQVRILAIAFLSTVNKRAHLLCAM